jgi:hypothetical protein
MSFRRILSITAVAALALAGAAWSVGPDLPALQHATLAAGTTQYVVRSTAAGTSVRKLAAGRLVARTTVPGGWGVQLVTYRGDLAGLSGDGRTLVLSDNVEASGRLRTSSRFAVLDTRRLALTRKITLRGDYGVDALSPRGDVLYLIHHVSNSDVTRYQVQAYDLEAGRLLPGVIADKTQAGWVMAGNPISRAATSDGNWVYTLYQQSNNYPFVHALDAAHRTAICIGLPLDWTKPWLSSAKLVLADGKLKVMSGSKTRAVLDTRTFSVSMP